MREMLTVLNNDVEAINGDVKVVLTYIGEGYDGYYDEDNPDDKPLIRADLYLHIDNEEPDESTCTDIPATTTIDVAQKIANRIAELVSKYMYDGKIRSEFVFLSAIYEASKEAGI